MVRQAKAAQRFIAVLIFFSAVCLPFVVFAQTSVTLTWTQNTEADLAGYEFHRAFIDCNTPNAATLLQPHVKVGKVGTYTETLPAGTKVVCYALKAFDTSNNFSALSNLAGKTFVRPNPVLQGHWTTKTDVPHAASQNLKAYTIHAVVNPKAAMTVFSPVLVKNYTYFFYAAVKGYCGDGAIMAGHTGTNRVCVNQPLPPNEWTAITATYDGTTLTVYRKGVAVGSMAMPSPLDSTDTMQIGGSKYNETCNCEQEVWLYDQALTAAEVASLPSEPAALPVIQVTPAVLSFTATGGPLNPISQSVVVANIGTGSLAWTAVSTQPWLTVTPSTGQSGDVMTVTVARGALAAGTYLGTIALSAPNATTVSIAVTFTVLPDTVPPQIPTDLKLSSRPTAGTAVLSWVQPGGPPDSYRIDYFKGTAWAELLRVPGSDLQTVVTLPDVGRRTYRICAVSGASLLCNNRDGIWLSR